MHPQKKVNCIWSPQFAYIIGLLATDGCLSIDGRHINFTSKDLELINIFKKYLGLNNKIGRKARGGEKEKKYFQVQFGDVNFYKFLLEIGLTSHKSKTIGPLLIKEDYFLDFIRGCLDGDGSIGTFRHPESRYPQLRIRLVSASKKFLKWLYNKIAFYGIKGGYIKNGNRAYVLEYAMADSKNLLSKIYYKDFPNSLFRKFIIAKPFLRT